MTDAPTRETITAAIQAIIDAAPTRWPIVADPWTGISIKTSIQRSPSCEYDVVTERLASGARKGPANWSHEAMMGTSGRILNEGIDRLTRQIMRHLRRRARIEAVGGQIDAPWAHTMHRLPLSAMREAGLDPAMLLMKADPENGRTMDGRQLLDMLSQQTDLSLGSFAIEDGRIDAHELDVGRNGSMRILGDGRPAIIVQAHIPETVAIALGGRLLSEVVDHPVIRRAGPLRIVQVHVSPGETPWTTFIVEDRQDFIRRPPTGADRRWNRIPFLPFWRKAP